MQQHGVRLRGGDTLACWIRCRGEGGLGNEDHKNARTYDRYNAEVPNLLFLLTEIYSVRKALGVKNYVPMNWRIPFVLLFVRSNFENPFVSLVW